MDTARMHATGIAIALSIALVACVPGSMTVDGGTCSDGGCDENAQGTLTTEGLALSWISGATWDQGWCLDMTLTNTGGDLEAWSLALRLDQPVETWLSADGALFSPDGDRLSIQPSGDSVLAAGNTVTMQCCMEPAARPVEISSAELEVPEGTPAPILGTVQDGNMLLAYRSDGVSYGGYCLEMTLTNLSEKDVVSWMLTLNLDQKAVLTDYWGFTPVVDGAAATVYPGPGTETIAAFGARTGTMCLSTLAEPVAMTSSVRYEDGTGTDPADTPTPEPVITGSLTDDPLLLTYRSTDPSKGGTCLELTFTNMSDKTVSTWEAQLSMTGPITLTDFWGVAPAVEGSLLTIYPGPGQHTIESHEARVGTVCLDPLETPVAMQSNVAYAAEDT